eukprot:9484738-Pyramimonas_sp.AAC.1
MCIRDSGDALRLQDAPLAQVRAQVLHVQPPLQAAKPQRGRGAVKPVSRSVGAVGVVSRPVSRARRGHMASVKNWRANPEG